MWRNPAQSWLLYVGFLPPQNFASAFSAYCYGRCLRTVRGDVHSTGDIYTVRIPSSANFTIQLWRQGHVTPCNLLVRNDVLEEPVLSIFRVPTLVPPTRWYLQTSRRHLRYVCNRLVWGKLKIHNKMVSDPEYQAINRRIILRWLLGRRKQVLWRLCQCADGMPSWEMECEEVLWWMEMVHARTVNGRFCGATSRLHKFLISWSVQ